MALMNFSREKLPAFIVTAAGADADVDAHRSVIILSRKRDSNARNYAVLCVKIIIKMKYYYHYFIIPPGLMANELTLI